MKLSVVRILMMKKRIIIRLLYDLVTSQPLAAGLHQICLRLLSCLLTYHSITVAEIALVEQVKRLGQFQAQELVKIQVMINP